MWKLLITISIISTMTLDAQNSTSISNKIVKIDNINLAYKDEGAGQIILCLHAIGHSSKDFESLYQLNLTEYRIISLDFPSHGLSEKADQNISATYFANIVLKFIDTLQLKNLIIVGNSVGGATAIRVASNNSNIKLLSLSNPGGLDKRGFLAPFFLNYMIRFFQKGVENNPKFKSKFENYYKKVLVTDTSVQRRNEIVKDCYALSPLLVQAWTSFKSDQEDLRPLISKISCPVLFTWGMKDKFVQFGRNRKAIEKFKDYQLIKYQIGHTPYVECPELFLKDFQEFIKLKLR
jgi:4,5:9,10-diseco-3-hydroxy-5,9,17-trioxoandrosta-1(10),2-diene-4-oate hydrolase